jgi:hypothetical protein
MSPGVHYLLDQLKPQPVPVDENLGGAIVRGVGSSDAQVPDVAHPAQVGGDMVGDVPLHEAKVAQAEFLKRLEGLDVEVKDAMLNAFLKKKYGMDDESISRLTRETESTTKPSAS